MPDTYDATDALQRARNAAVMTLDRMAKVIADTRRHLDRGATDLTHPAGRLVDDAVCLAGITARLDVAAMVAGEEWHGLGPNPAYVEATLPLGDDHG